MTPREKEEAAKKALFLSAAFQKTYDEHWFIKRDGLRIYNRLKLLVYHRYNKAVSFDYHLAKQLEKLERCERKAIEGL